MSVGDATIATATGAMPTGDGQIEIATNGGNVRRTFGVVKTIANDSGRFAISTSVKCVA
jgi:hypothetical protein